MDIITCCILHLIGFYKSFLLNVSSLYTCYANNLLSFFSQPFLMTFPCRTIASNTPTYILQNTDAPHSDDPSWPDTWDQVSKVAMVTLTLQGHEEHLFKRHISFKECRKYMDAPHMSPAILHAVYRCIAPAATKQCYGISHQVVGQQH